MNKKNSLRLAIASTCLAFATISNYTHAEVFKYHPNSPLYLGGGFDNNKLDRGVIPCIIHDGAVPAGELVTVAGEAPDSDSQPKNHPVRDMSFSLSLIETTSQLYEQMNIDASISARFTFGSGGGSYSLEEALGIDKNDIAWVISGKSDFGEYALKNVRINESVIQPPGPDAKDIETFKKNFYTKCGTHFVAQEKRSAQISAVFIAHNLSHEERTNLEASFRANSSFLGGSYSASANLKQFYDFASSVSSVSIHIVAIGGPGLPEIEEVVNAGETTGSLVNNPDVDLLIAEASDGIAHQDLEKVKNTIASYLSKLDEKNAVAIQYHATPYSALIPELEITVPTAQNYVLSEIFFQFTDMAARLSQVHSVLRSPEALATLSEEGRESYRKEFIILNEKISEYYEYAEACLNNQHASVDGNNHPTLFSQDSSSETDVVKGICQIPPPPELTTLPAVISPDLYFEFEYNGGEAMRLVARHPLLVSLSLIRKLEANNLGDKIVFWETLDKDDSPVPFPSGESVQSMTLQAVVDQPIGHNRENFCQDVLNTYVRAEYGNAGRPVRVIMKLTKIIEENWSELYLEEVERDSIRLCIPDRPEPSA